MLHLLNSRHIRNKQINFDIKEQHYIVDHIIDYIKYNAYISPQTLTAYILIMCMYYYSLKGVNVFKTLHACIGQE